MIWRERELILELGLGKSKMNPEHLVAQIRRKLLKKKKKEKEKRKVWYYVTYTLNKWSS